MSAPRGGFNVPAVRSFRLWREITPGADGYRLAVASLAEEAARLATADGREVNGMSFTVERMGDGDRLQLVVSGSAPLVSKGSFTYRAIGGQS